MQRERHPCPCPGGRGLLMASRASPVPNLSCGCLLTSERNKMAAALSSRDPPSAVSSLFWNVPGFPALKVSGMLFVFVLYGVELF